MGGHSHTAIAGTYWACEGEEIIYGGCKAGRRIVARVDIVSGRRPNGAGDNGLSKLRSCAINRTVGGPSLHPVGTTPGDPHVEWRSTVGNSNGAVILQPSCAVGGDDGVDTRRCAVVIGTKINEILCVLLHENSFLLVTLGDGRIEFRHHIEIDVSNGLQQSNSLILIEDVVIGETRHHEQRVGTTQLLEA